MEISQKPNKKLEQDVMIINDQIVELNFQKGMSNIRSDKPITKHKTYINKITKEENPQHFVMTLYMMVFTLMAICLLFGIVTCVLHCGITYLN